MEFLSRGGAVLFFLLLAFSAQAANPLDVIINEIAWMGTEASHADEWIELYNDNDSSVNLEGWALKTTEGAPKINLVGIISAKGFYLLERTDETTLSDIAANQIYTGALKNSGESLELYNNLGILIDSVDCSSGWFAGDNSAKQTMERINPQLPGSHLENWGTSQNPGGTPKAENSPTVQTKAPLKELAAIGEQVPKSSGPLSIFLIALALAVFSGIIILILKKKIKLNYNKKI